MPGIVVTASNTITRPADTTAYTAGDLVANSTTAGSVTPFIWPIGGGAGQKGKIWRARIKKSTTTTANAGFKVHLFDGSQALTVTNGDNGAFAPSNANALANYLGWLEGTATSTTTVGVGAVTFCSTLSSHGSFVGVRLPASIWQVYGLLEATAAYAPGSAETFFIELEAEFE